MFQRERRGIIIRRRFYTVPIGLSDKVLRRRGTELFYEFLPTVHAHI
jgi:hypothetical protein